MKSFTRDRINMLVFWLLIGPPLLHLGESSGSGRHSLWVMASYISGPTQFPEFSVVMMLDDIQVGYYDSQVNRMMRSGGGGEKGAELGLGQEMVFVLKDIMAGMRNRLNLVKDQLNLTSAGVYVHQRLAGCELQDDKPAFIMTKDASNSQDTDSLWYNTTHFTYITSSKFMFKMDSMKKALVQTLYTNIYMPVSIRTLRQLLDRERTTVMRRIKPRVRLMRKPVVGGVQLTCLATEFYPRHINLTLLRDGVPVDELHVSGGSVLPNANGLYQVRKTLLVDEEELQKTHKYTCTASHLSLDNRLDVSWRAESLRSYRVYAISVPVLLVAVVVLLLVLLGYRKRGQMALPGRHSQVSCDE